MIKKFDRKYKDLAEIQATFDERVSKIGKDYYEFYYNSKNVCVIHIKFGDMRKNYSGLKVENGISQEIIDKYNKIWNRSLFMSDTGIRSQIRDFIELVRKENAPIIFYKNMSDTEIRFNDLIDYFEKEWLSEDKWVEIHKLRDTRLEKIRELKRLCQSVIDANNNFEKNWQEIEKDFALDIMCFGGTIKAINRMFETEKELSKNTNDYTLDKIKDKVRKAIKGV